MEIRIAIVDSQVLFREGMRALLEANKGLRVTMHEDTIENFIEAVDRVAKEDWPDAIIMDMASLQRKSGYVTRCLFHHYPDIRIIIVNVADNPVSKRLLTRIDAHEYFLQGSSVCDLTESLYGIKQKDRDSFVELMCDEHMDGSNEHNLSPREIEVMRCLCQEYTSKQIADKLFISQKTVGHHREKIQKKIGVVSTAGIIVYAMKNNLI